MTDCDSIKPPPYHIMIVQYFCMADSDVLITHIPKTIKVQYLVCFNMLLYQFLLLLMHVFDVIKTTSSSIPTQPLSNDSFYITSMSIVTKLGAKKVIVYTSHSFTY